MHDIGRELRLKEYQRQKEDAHNFECFTSGDCIIILSARSIPDVSDSWRGILRAFP